jgi:hypothetical protein
MPENGILRTDLSHSRAVTWRLGREELLTTHSGGCFVEKFCNSVSRRRMPEMRHSPHGFESQQSCDMEAGLRRTSNHSQQRLFRGEVLGVALQLRLTQENA